MRILQGFEVNAIDMEHLHVYADSNHGQHLTQHKSAEMQRWLMIHHPENQSMGKNCNQLLDMLHNDFTDFSIGNQSRNQRMRCSASINRATSEVTI
jgi:hypothetical protein